MNFNSVMNVGIGKAVLIMLVAAVIINQFNLVSQFTGPAT